MVRSDIFKKIGGYNEEIAVAEDNEFFGRLSKEGLTKMDFKILNHKLWKIRKYGLEIDSVKSFNLW